jgi:hypothetical protein
MYCIPQRLVPGADYDVSSAPGALSHARDACNRWRSGPHHLCAPPAPRLGEGGGMGGRSARSTAARAGAVRISAGAGPPSAQPGGWRPFPVRTSNSSLAGAGGEGSVVGRRARVICVAVLGEAPWAALSGRLRFVEGLSLDQQTSGAAHARAAPFLAAALCYAATLLRGGGRSIAGRPFSLKSRARCGISETRTEAYLPFRGRLAYEAPFFVSCRGHVGVRRAASPREYPAMQTYRLEVFEPPDERLRHRREFEAPNDAEACKRVVEVLRLGRSAGPIRPI